jgi:2-haloacid dehalogenase
MIDFGRYEALTFDCYGTLIDWEAGILRALDELLVGRSMEPSSEELLECFGRFEPAAEQGVFRPYREVLIDVARRFGDTFGVRVDDGSADRFALSVRRWPPFSDSVEALAALAGVYRLAIVSNVDDDLFASSAAQLGVDFDEVVTAEQVGSYKPGRAHFDEVLSRLELPRDRVLHVAQSLHHDVAPAKALGLSCVWVNRRSGRSGTGATPPSEAVPDLEVPDLASLARMAVTA